MSLMCCQLFLLLVIMAAVKLASLTTEELATSFFVKTKVCVDSTDVLSFSYVGVRSNVECGLACASNAKCASYARVNSSVCLFYRSAARGDNGCTSTSAALINVFLRLLTSCLNGATLASDGVSCQCVNSFVGTHCERLMEDCSDGYINGGYREDRKYWIKPALAPYSFQVHCHMSLGAGLTLIQMRTNANIDFNKTWTEYKAGFEITDNEDFWLGNGNIHWITVSVAQILMVQLTRKNSKTYQYYYDGFKMADETENYAVSYVRGWSNDNTDAKKTMDACWPGTSTNFSTWDRDNDSGNQNCAKIYGAGFWFKGDNCTSCNPNGMLYPGEDGRINIPNENFWTPNLGDWTPDRVTIVLFQK